MTSFKQFQANRRNAQKSSGPRTEQGKQRSSRNALRHGLTAETVIEPIEDAKDYRAFEQSVTADYDPVTAVERELILRLASLLWRLRRATSIETGLFQIDGALQLQSEELAEQKRSRDNPVTALVIRDPTAVISDPALPRGGYTERYVFSYNPAPDPPANSGERSSDKLVLARCFLRLAQLDDGVFERLGRYEATLWRQVRQTLFTLASLRGKNRGLSRQFRPQEFA